MVASNLAGVAAPALGAVFPLTRFGWTGSPEIGRPLQDACTAAAEVAGIGVVEVPPGYWLSNRDIIIPPCEVGPDPNQTGVHIRGAAIKGCSVFFHAGSDGIKFRGKASAGGNYVNGPQISDMTLRMNGGAVGLQFYECIFPTASRMHVYGAASAAVQITDGGFNFGCQNIHLDRVTAALSTRGFHLKQALNITAVGCISNQNFGKGWHIEQCNGATLVGGMNQDQGIPIHIQPNGFNSIRLSIVGNIYQECPTKNLIQIDRAPQGPGYIGNINIIGGLTVQGGHDATGEVILASDCALIVAGGRIEAPGWATHIRTSGPLESLTLDGLSANRSLYDLDADTLTRTTISGAGNLELGGVRMRQSSGRLEVSTDGVTWRRLALE